MGQLTSFTIDSSSGDLTWAWATLLSGNLVPSIVTNAPGTYVYATTGTHLYAYSVNPSTGALTSVMTALPFDVGGMFVHSAHQKLYFNQSLYNYFGSFAIDSITGATGA